jgi:hypothetical protein
MTKKDFINRWCINHSPTFEKDLESVIQDELTSFVVHQKEARKFINQAEMRKGK